MDKKNHIKNVLAKTAKKGRGGDTLLAHLSPKASKTLKSAGGSGTINPKTGLKEYIWGIPYTFGNMHDDKEARWDRESAAGAARRAQEEAARQKAEMAARVQRSNMGDLAAPQLYEEAQKLIAGDRARLANTPQPIYRGAMSAPKSSMTQRAEDLSAQGRAQPAPYSNEINSVLARPNVGFTPPKQQGAIDYLRTGQQGIADNVATPTLTHQFGSQYSPQNFNTVARNTVSGNLGEANENLNRMSGNAADIGAKRNNTLADLLTAMQAGSLSRRNTLTSNLSTLGKQHQAHGNFTIDTNKSDFERDAQMPHIKADTLERGMSSASGFFGDNAHPDLQKPYGQELARALQAYGIDKKSPVSSWGDPNTRMSSPRFTGQRVAPLTPEMMASYSMMNAVEPDFQNANTPEKNKLLGDLVNNNQSLGDEALGAAPNSIGAKTSNMSMEAQRHLSKQMSALTNKYLRSGQYGSPQHIREAEDRARDVTQGAGQEHSKDFLGAVGNQFNSLSNRDNTNMGQVARLAGQEHNEFGQAVGNIMGLNSLGENKWRVNQDDNDNEYKSFQSESNWRWPVAYGTIYKNAMNAGLGQGAGERNSLRTQLADMDSRYTTAQGDREKEFASSQAQIQNLGSQIKSQEDAQRAQAQAMQAAQAHSAQLQQREQQRQQQMQAQQAAQERERQQALQRQQQSSAAPMIARLDQLGDAWQGRGSWQGRASMSEVDSILHQLKALGVRDTGRSGFTLGANGANKSAFG